MKRVSFISPANLHQVIGGVRKLLALAVTCTAFMLAVVGSVNAQENPLLFGINAGVILSGATGDGNKVIYDGFGWGGGGGLTMRYSIVESFKIRVDANFDYRNIGESGDLTEMAICIPVTAYYHWTRWYVGLGLGVDIPFAHSGDDNDEGDDPVNGNGGGGRNEPNTEGGPKARKALNGKSLTGDAIEEVLVGRRSSVDVGYTIGLGFMVTPKLALDFRSNNNFTKMYSGGPLSNTSMVQHTESVKIIYFF